MELLGLLQNESVLNLITVAISFISYAVHMHSLKIADDANAFANKQACITFFTLVFLCNFIVEIIEVSTGSSICDPRVGTAVASTSVCLSIGANSKMHHLLILVITVIGVLLLSVCSELIPAPIASVALMVASIIVFTMRIFHK